MGDNPHAGHRILYFHWRAFIYRMSNGAVCIALTWGYSKWSMAHCWNYLLLVVPCFFWISQNFCRMNPNRADQTGHAGKLILIWGKTHTTQCWCYKIKTIYICFCIVQFDLLNLICKIQVSLVLGLSSFNFANAQHAFESGQAWTVWSIPTAIVRPLPVNLRSVIVFYCLWIPEHKHHRWCFL